MTGAIATALATMTGDNLLDTDQWEIRKHNQPCVEEGLRRASNATGSRTPPAWAQREAH